MEKDQDEGVMRMGRFFAAAKHYDETTFNEVGRCGVCAIFFAFNSKFQNLEETSLYDPPRVKVQGVARDNPYLSPILDGGFGRLKFWGPPIQKCIDSWSGTASMEAAIRDPLFLGGVINKQIAESLNINIRVINSTKFVPGSNFPYQMQIILITLYGMIRYLTCFHIYTNMKDLYLIHTK